MRARLFTTGAALLMLLTLAATPALARGRGHRGRTASRAMVMVAPQRDFDSERFDRARRDRTTRVVFYGDRFSSAQRPPGWNRGRKTGWGSCDLPPGLAKKYGCHQSFILRSRLPRTDAVFQIPFFFVDDR